MKKLSSFIILAACLVAISLLIGCTSVAQPSIPTDAKDIAVTNIKRMNFDTLVSSNLAWVPNEENSVAGVVNGFGDGDIVRAYDLATGESKDLYNLKEYGMSLGNGITFFWSADGKRIVTSSGGVIDLETKTGRWVKSPDGSKAEDINVLGISPDGKMLLVHVWGKGPIFMNADSGQYSLFSVRTDIFSARFGALAWSPDGKWIAAGSYDPDHLPKDVFEALDAPQALYLLSADGEEARLIARNIEGNIDTVTFSPDGSKLVWKEARKGEQYIYIANVDGTGAHEIFSNANLPSEYNVASNLLWSQDGRRIVFVGPADKEYYYPFWTLTLGESANPVSTSQP